MMKYPFHTPVLIKEAVGSLNVRPGCVYVDGTVGGGGHAYHILNEAGPTGVLVCIDLDEDALRESQAKLEAFGNRKVLIKGNYSNIKKILEDLNIKKVDGILLDLGVSSHQLESPDRGFSFASDAPLDMRMNRYGDVSAYDLVNELPEKELIRIIREYGEEKGARRIARAILAERKVSPIKTTAQLAALIVNALPYQLKRGKIHPATRTFQALRIVVNDELASLQRSINDGIDVLEKNGRFSIISFHSLEDRIVKNLFRSWEKACVCPPDFPQCVCNKVSKVKVITRKPVRPGDDEITANPRARSARLRTAERI